MKKNDIPMLGVKREENDNKAFSNQKGGTMKNVLPIKWKHRQNRKLLENYITYYGKLNNRKT